MPSLILNTQARRNQKVTIREGNAWVTNQVSVLNAGTDVIPLGFEDGYRWDGRGRFGDGMEAGTYSGWRVTLASEHSVQRVCRLGLNYGPDHVQGIGNDTPPVATVAISGGRIVTIAGFGESVTHMGIMAADDTYYARPTGGGDSLGAIGVVRLTPPGAEWIVHLTGKTGLLYITYPETGQQVLGYTPTHPPGWDASSFNHHTACTAGAGSTFCISYLLLNRVDEYSIATNGTISFVRSFTVTAPSGLAVGTDGRPLVIAGVTATVDSTVHNELVSTSGGNVLRLNADGTSTEVATSGFCSNPFRLSVDSDTGDIAVASWAPNHQVHIFSAGWVLQRSLGRQGGRLDGAYVETDFFQPCHVAWDDGDLWVNEFEACARVLRKIDVTSGLVLRALYGGQRFEASCCPEGGDDPTRVWAHGGFGLNRYSLDPSTGEWQLLETYQSVRGDYVALNISAFKELKSLRLNGVIYLYTSGQFFAMWVYDPATPRLRMVACCGALAASGDCWMTSAQQAAANSLWPGKYQYVWTAPLGSTAYLPSFLPADVKGWNRSLGGVWIPREINVGPDLSLWIGRSRLPCMIPCTSVRADGVPVYDVTAIRTFDDLVVDGEAMDWDYSDLMPAGDHVYHLIGMGRGGDRSNGAATTGQGQYFHSGNAAVAYLAKRDAVTGDLVWISGLKESGWNAQPGRMHWARKIGCVYRGLVWCFHSGDSEGGGGVALFDTLSGAWVCDLTASIASAPPHPSFWKLGIVTGDICTVNVCRDPDDASDALVFLSNLSYGSVLRVKGISTFDRTRITETLLEAVPTSAAAGTGLTLTAYNNATLSGSPALSVSGNFLRLSNATLAPVTADPFSFILSGSILPLRSGAYQFVACPYNRVDSDFRVWVGGQLVTDTTSSLGQTGRTGSTLRQPWTAPVTLTAGVAVTVRVEGRNVSRSDPGGLIGDWARYIALLWRPPLGDLHDVPASRCFPTEAASLSPLSVGTWEWPDYPTEMHWPLTTLASGLTTGTGVPPLRAYGDVTASVDQDGAPCLLMVSRFDAPAILHTPLSPWPFGYEGWAAGGGDWAVEMKLKTSEATGKSAGFGAYRSAAVFGNSYYTAPGLVLYAGGLTVLDIGAQGNMAVSLDTGAWRTIRVEVATDASFYVDGNLIGTLDLATTTARPLAPPHGLAISAPVPSVAGVDYTWRVRDFKVFPRG